jgi:hypothetical protein
MVRNYAYHEEIKILMAEVFRNGDETDTEWTAKYESLKENAPLEKMGELIGFILEMEYTLTEAVAVVKQLLIERKTKWL